MIYFNKERLFGRTEHDLFIELQKLSLDACSGEDETEAWVELWVSQVRLRCGWRWAAQMRALKGERTDLNHAE